MRKTKGEERERERERDREREILTNREASLWICSDEMKSLEIDIRE
jgi:hypothetical protein